MNPSEPRLKGSRRDFLKQLGLMGATVAVGGEVLERLPAGVATAEAAETGMTAAAPSFAYHVLNKMGFGPRPGDIAAFEALGADDSSRLAAYVAQQLNPGSITDTEFETRLSQMNLVTLNKSLTQLWREHRRSNNYSTRILPLRETQRVTFMKALYSKKQLLEMTADFWHNHFNVYADSSQIGSTWVYYDRDVIRANAFGNFRTMLGMVAKSPAMLYYLNNDQNKVAGPNENYARELFELHTLGAENYLGVQPQSGVPQDGNGIPVGYVDGDVYEATRCFTGWTVNDDDDYNPADTGEVYFNQDWHDRFKKDVLGTEIANDQTAQTDGEMVLDLVAYHPGTATYIARKLCKRFISDNPPESLVTSAANVFYTNRLANDQIKLTLEHILLSAEFSSTWGEKVKRPFEYVTSALRALDIDFTIQMSGGDSNNFMYTFERTGQEFFHWRTPDGYPDFKEAWLSTNPLLQGWRFIKWFLGERDSDKNYYVDVVAQSPASPTSATALADFWIDRLHHRTLDPALRQEIIDFMAQEDDPNEDLPIYQSKWPGDLYRNRLRTMCAIILQAPAFYER